MSRMQRKLRVRVSRSCSSDEMFFMNLNQTRKKFGSAPWSIGTVDNAPAQLRSLTWHFKFSHSVFHIIIIEKLGRICHEIVHIYQAFDNTVLIQCFLSI